MRKYLSFCVFVLFLLLLFSSCKSSSNLPIKQTEILNFDENTISENYGHSGVLGYIEIEDIKNPWTQESKYYKILGDNNNYYYYIYDNNKEVVSNGGVNRVIPKITMVNDNIVKFQVQMGTGIGTTETFYYNVEKDVLSRWFNSVYAETGELLVYAFYKKIIVRNIFDKTAYYCEFTDFEDISDITEPFKDIVFVNNGKRIKVTYLTGNDYQEVVKIVNLND